jgi:hypothetical protein
VKDENARWLAGRVISSIESKAFSSIADPFIPPNLPFRNCYRSYLHDEIAGMEQEIQKIHMAFIEGRGKERERRRGKEKEKEKETGNGRYEDTEINIGDDERQEDGAKNGCHSNGNCKGGGEGNSVDAHSCSENIGIAVGKKSYSQSYTHTHTHTHTNCSIGDSSDSILRVKRKFNDVEKGSVCNTPTPSSSSSASASASISAAATYCANHIDSTAPLLSFRSIADESGINVPQGPQSALNIGIDPGSDSMNAAGSAAVALVPVNSAYLDRCHNDDFETFTR